MAISKIKRLGLIAGNGTLPVILAEQAKLKGVDVVSIAFTKKTIDLIKPFSSCVYKFGIGQVGKMLKILKKEDVFHVVLAGKVEKSLLFRNPRLDYRTIRALAGLKDRKDDTIMNAVVKEIHKEGMKVIDQTFFLKDLFPGKGLIAGRMPNAEQIRNIEFGFRIAREIAALDIGQTIVVKDYAVLAVEAIEGTDEAIRRGCSICGHGGIVVKVAKPRQDQRFDVPTVGVVTIKTIFENKGSVLAVEAEKTMLIKIEEIIKAAEDAGISIVAI